MKQTLIFIIMFSHFGYNKVKSQENKTTELPLFGEIRLNPTKDYETMASCNGGVTAHRLDSCG